MNYNKLRFYRSNSNLWKWTNLKGRPTSDLWKWANLTGRPPVQLAAPAISGESGRDLTRPPAQPTCSQADTEAPNVHWTDKRDCKPGEARVASESILVPPEPTLGAATSILVAPELMLAPSESDLGATGIDPGGT